jgi:hypothetical protein
MEKYERHQFDVVVIGAGGEDSEPHAYGNAHSTRAATIVRAVAPP